MRHIFFKNCRRAASFSSSPMSKIWVSDPWDSNWIKHSLVSYYSDLGLHKKVCLCEWTCGAFSSVPTAVSGIECVGTRQSFSERDIEEEKAFAHFRKARQILRFPSFSFLTTHWVPQQKDLAFLSPKPCQWMKEFSFSWIDKASTTRQHSTDLQNYTDLI